LNSKDNYTIIANADDLGLRISVNSAILQCFNAGFINSASLMTNSSIFDETVAMIKSEMHFKNIGIHIDLVEFRPLTSFNVPHFLDKNGNWRSAAINNKFLFLNRNEKNAFEKEIHTQIEKVFSAGLTPVHLDSHYHIHTLPAFYKLFIKAAKKYNLKLRLAQSYNEGSYITFLYRKWLNNLIKKNSCAYTDLFQDVQHYLALEKTMQSNLSVEIMLHPDLDDLGNLTDHYHPQTMTKWLGFLNRAGSNFSR
jgi:chitin disaccharide deacetylase